MRIRLWMAGLVLAGMTLAGAPAPARAAIWPFSLFAAKPPVKHTRPKPGKTRPGMRLRPGHTR